MLFIMKVFLFLCFSTNLVFAGACCSSCQEGHTCESQKSKLSQLRYPRLLVFASFSMPMETLKVLAKQVDTIGGAIVFRGLENGNFKDAAIKLKELGQELIIDPTLFEAYDITIVPTFILREKSTDEADTKVIHDRLSGNVSLLHVLEQFVKQGDTRKTAQSLLNKLKE